MIYLYWNSRGLANNPTKLALRRLIIKNKLDFLFSSESWMTYGNFSQKWSSKLGLKLITNNFRPNNIANLWCFCKIDLDSVILSISEKHIVFTFTFENKCFWLVFIYASTSYLKRRDLWHDLSSIIYNHKIHWSIFGDFNMVMGAHEYLGASSPAILPIQGFQY